jgi:hypothetical protein
VSACISPATAQPIIFLRRVLPFAASALAVDDFCLQEGMLPIHLAAWFNRLDVAALLLDKGSMINPPTKVKIVEGGRGGV